MKTQLNQQYLQDTSNLVISKQKIKNKLKLKKKLKYLERENLNKTKRKKGDHKIKAGINKEENKRLTISKPNQSLKMIQKIQRHHCQVKGGKKKKEMMQMKQIQNKMRNNFTCHHSNK